MEVQRQDRRGRKLKRQCHASPVPSYSSINPVSALTRGGIPSARPQEQDMTSDQQIRDDLQDRLKARAEVIGHEPDGEDVAAVIGETALRFDVQADRVRDL